MLSIQLQNKQINPHSKVTSVVGDAQNRLSVADQMDLRVNTPAMEANNLSSSAGTRMVEEEH